MSLQNDIDTIRDRLDRGLLTVAQANVEIVKTERFRLVTGSLKKEVRSALNAAVKAGELGHLKKDGIKPETFFHPTFEYLAKEARNKHARDAVEALLRVCV